MLFTSFLEGSESSTLAFIILMDSADYNIKDFRLKRPVNWLYNTFKLYWLTFNLSIIITPIHLCKIKKPDRS